MSAAAVPSLRVSIDLCCISASPDLYCCFRCDNVQISSLHVLLGRLPGLEARGTADMVGISSADRYKCQSANAVWWTFAYARYDDMIRQLRAMALVEMIIEELPRPLRRLLATSSGDKKEEDKSRVPSDLWNKLYDYQKQGVEYCLRRSGRVLIGDEMGLGKTIQTICCLAHFADDWPVLIVCPSICRENWRRELLRHLPPNLLSDSDGKDIKSAEPPVDSTAIVVLYHTKDMVDLASKLKSSVKFVIVSYKLAVMGKLNLLNDSSPSSQSLPSTSSQTSTSTSTQTSPLQTQQSSPAFRSVVIDESHNLNNYKSQQTQALVPLVQQARRAFLLSGTSLTRPKDLFSQLNALLPAYFANFVTFAQRYCDPRTKTIMMRKKQKVGDQGQGQGTKVIMGKAQRERVVSYNGCARLHELHALLTRLLLLRRTKTEVLHQLPEKRRIRHYLDTTPKLRERLAKLKKKHGDDFMALFSGLGPLKAGPARELIEYRLRQLFPLAGNKDKDNDNDEDNNDKNGNDKKLKTKPDPSTNRRIVLFAHHQVVMNELQVMLEQMELEYVRVDGQTDKKMQQTLLDHFQSGQSGCQVALLSMTATGIGVTLTSSCEAYFVELHPEPKILMQAEDRLHRIGQSHNVTIHYLLMPGSIDERLWQLTNDKHQTLSAVVDGQARRFG